MTNYDDCGRNELIALLEKRDEQPVSVDADELKAANEARAVARNEAYRARSELTSFQESVRDAFKELVDGNDLDRSVANDVLESLGVKKLNSIFTVTMTVQVTVEGIEAEDASEAEEKVQNDYSVDITCESRTFDFELSSVESEEE